MRSPITPEERLALTLRYLATGMSITYLGVHIRCLVAFFVIVTVCIFFCTKTSLFHVKKIRATQNVSFNSQYAMSRSPLPNCIQNYFFIHVNQI